MNFCMSEFLRGNCRPYRGLILKGFGSAQRIRSIIIIGTTEAFEDVGPVEDQ